MWTVIDTEVYLDVVRILIGSQKAEVIEVLKDLYCQSWK